MNPRIVLIDDDHSYNAVMLRVAREEGIELECYDSLMDLGSVGMLGRYDVAIVDYDLGQINGVEIAEYLSALFADIPMLLISHSPRSDSDPKHAWPPSIAGFVAKSRGYRHLLARAKELAPGNSCRDAREASAG